MDEFFKLLSQASWIEIIAALLGVPTGLWGLKWGYRIGTSISRALCPDVYVGTTSGYLGKMLWWKVFVPLFFAFAGAEIGWFVVSGPILVIIYLCGGAETVPVTYRYWGSELHQIFGK